MGRQATDYFLPLAFALGWLLCLWECQRRDSAGIAVGTGLVLGLGLFSYITSWMVMPLYLALTYLMLWRGGKSLRFMALVATGFALPLLPLAVWLTANPSMPGDVFTNYRVSTGLRLVERISLYWDYFNPAFLFLTGGVLFPPVIVLMPLGLFALLREESTPLTRLWLAGLAVSPLAAALTAETPIPARAIYITPFAAIIAAAGVQYLFGLVRQRR